MIYIINMIKYNKGQKENKMDDKNKYSEYLKNAAEFNECEDDLCDLDKTKVCNSCGKCLEEEKKYKIIKITKIITHDKD